MQYNINGNYTPEIRKKPARKKKRKTLAVALTVLILACLFAGSTIAYISTKSDKVDNTFKAGSVSNEVVETFDGTTKKDVKVKNTGNTSVYVKANIVASWVSEDGNSFYATTPSESTDYTISYPANTNWVKSSDGFWYYKVPVAAGAETGNLIDSCALAAGAVVPDGYRLSIEIVSETIQAEPVTAVTGSWSSGVSSVATDGTLTIAQ